MTFLAHESSAYVMRALLPIIDARDSKHLTAREAEDIERDHRGSYDDLAHAYDHGSWGGGRHHGDYRSISGTGVFTVEPGVEGGPHDGLRPISWREARDVETYHRYRH